LKPITLNTKHQQEALCDIKEYFFEERDEQLSDFQAQNLLEFILNSIGPSIYNQAIADAHAVMSNNVEDLFGLEKRIMPVDQKHVPR
jgi:uncharacterized protein (DUF2164 family)